jgi:hypothetical protein
MPQMPPSPQKMEDAKIERAIAYARGDSHRQLADLSPRDKDIAELGARRAIAFLNGAVFAPTAKGASDAQP